MWNKNAVRGWSFALIVTVMAMLAAGAPVREQNVVGAPGCGPGEEKFDVKPNKNEHPEAKLEGGKAVVYFLQDDREFLSTPKPVVREGIDGKWAGATHGTSYLWAMVEPGEHHLCASWQASVGLGMEKQSAALHFTAEAGKAYFFAVRNRWNHVTGPAPIKFEAVDSDEGKLLIGLFAHAAWQPKK